MQIFDPIQTGNLLPTKELVSALRKAALQYGEGKIVSPERLVVKLREGGVMLSMPAVADDIAIHKLVNVNPRNADSGLPTIQGQVIACDPQNGKMLFQVDGPTVTAKRTAAVTVLAIDTFLHQAPRRVLIVGDGRQAGNHAEALAEIYPDTDIRVRGYSEDSTTRFVQALRSTVSRLAMSQGEDDEDVVITVTTSKTPVYRGEAKAGRLVIGVGAFTPDAAEIHPDIIRGSELFADDVHGAKAEAGDFIQAEVDWSRVGSLGSALSSAPDLAKPIVFKSVGTGAWDLAACRVIRRAINSSD